jgi:hypothetical protein
MEQFKRLLCETEDGTNHVLAAALMGRQREPPVYLVFDEAKVSLRAAHQQAKVTAGASLDWAT